MAFVFQPDPSLPNFNSFTTTSFADDYQVTKLSGGWAAATTDTKQKLLAWASRLLSQLEWQGNLTNIEQPLAWPRSYVYRVGGQANATIYDQYQFPWDTIPAFVQEATADLAGNLLEGDTTSPDGTEGFKKLKVDTIEMEMNAPDRLSWLPSSTRMLCQRYLLNSSKYTTSTVRVG